jgi:exodeoxyribonuclease V gamma subunit
VLQIHTAGRIEPLAAHLAEVLSVAPADPMTPEWIAVPSEGMRRWLYLELARHLGAGPAGGDGVAANIISGFPDSLRRTVLGLGGRPVGADGTGDPGDPWEVDRLVWSVLAELVATSDPVLHQVAHPPDGMSIYARARRIADLFDRYHLHRPDMVRAWAAGAEVDGTGQPLAEHQRWQPVLWRRVRDRLGAPSPPERLRGLLDQLLDPDTSDPLMAELDRVLPPRLALFGVSVLPGGVAFLDLVDAVGAVREVHLYMVQPSPVAAERVAEVVVPRPDHPRLRAEDHTDDQVNHPLLVSWGRLHRETTVLLADAAGQGVGPARRVVDEGDVEDGTTLLGRLQADLRADRAPVSDLVPDAVDRTIALHAAHGVSRQVDVLRDVVLHLLEDPTLDLTEDDIVVMVPALEQMAPLIEAVLGPSSDGPHRRGTPSLRYRIADRSLRRSVPLLDAVLGLLELLGGRFEITAVLDLVALGPVRARFGFSDDDVARIGEWAVEANVRWGLDETHRELAGMDPRFDTNTWRAALDRLLVGVAVAGDDHLSVGETLPIGVDGGDAALAGRLAELLWRLDRLAVAARTDHPLAEWLSMLRAAVPQLFDVAPEDGWQRARLSALLEQLQRDAAVEPATESLQLSLLDLRRLFAERLTGSPGRADFFRGGVTIASLTPLRGVPFRAVILLGVDQPAFSAGAPDGDDLSAAVPQLGDRDRRGESRQALLDAVLAARDRLVVIREGADVRTNHPVPPAVPVAELVEAVLSSVHPDHRDEVAERLEVQHPRQAFDEGCFLQGGLGIDGPFSFDHGAHRGATARRDRRADGWTFLRAPLPAPDTSVIELASLHSFLKDPTAAFVRDRLGVRFPRTAESPSVLLPLNLSGLDRYDVGNRLLRWMVDGGSVQDWLRIERRRGTLGPGPIGDETVEFVHAVATNLMAAAAVNGMDLHSERHVAVDVELPDGTRVVGTVRDQLSGDPGAAQLLFSADRPAYHLASWLDLMALAATDPERLWRSVRVARAQGSENRKVVDATLRCVDADAGRHGLAVAVDCYRRGMVEPIPLFPAVSRALWQGDSPTSAWRSYSGGGEGASDEAILVHGEADLHELLRLPRLDHDPITESGRDAGRIQCFAEYLWSAVESTCTATCTDDDEGAE